MIKKQQKWIALLVVFTFMWLLQVSTMPVAAAGAVEKVSAAKEEQGPGFFEASGYVYAPAKKSILPVVLIVVGVAAAAAVLFLVVLKSKYDIRGSWAMTITSTKDPANVEHWIATYTGTKTSGDVEFAANYGAIKLRYSVDGKNISFLFSDPTKQQMSGQFFDKDNMTGTYTYFDQVFNWSASRIVFKEVPAI
jgi:hypothetical protein